jgi:hypothetical protein
MEMIEAFISFVCLVSLIVVLLEAQRLEAQRLAAQRAGGFRRRWPIAVWAGGLFSLAMLTLLRVWIHLDAWSDLRILMGIVGAGNFLAGGGLLVRWLCWAPPSRR